MFDAGIYSLLCIVPTLITICIITIFSNTQLLYLETVADAGIYLLLCIASTHITTICIITILLLLIIPENSG